MKRSENIKRTRITVAGTVQGVGFRPTVYKYAQELGLAGYVMNTPEGVTIEVQGTGPEIDSFIKKISQQPPPLARITGFEVQDVVPEDESDFRILTSRHSGSKEAEISPDIATCGDCLSEMLDPKNRRHLYPFTNCTNCGPRFSIIVDRPYDRKNTSMSVFRMCADCQGEYDDPSDRRFHAQPNACPKCGPSLKLLGKEGVLHDQDQVISETVALLRKGACVAIKSIGGFNIACDPLDPDAIKRLRAKKNRPSKSFALMARDVPTIERFCFVSEKEKQTLLSKAAPIVLLRKKNGSLDHISPDNNYVGMVLPFTPLHHVICRDIELIVMTSANRSEEPIAINDDQIMELVKEGLVDFALTHNREIIHRCDDSIVQLMGNDVHVIRRARGYVPSAFNVGNAVPGDNISLGANLKNTFAIKKRNKVYVSQHIGDLMELRNYEYQKSEIEKFTKLMNIEPEVIKIDAHPGYENYDPSHSKVFHHHAHAVGAIWENGLLGNRTLAVICDGTGYGQDGNIWGFEFLDIGEDHRSFERISHLEYFPLPGGERAIDEVDRIAVSLSRNMSRSRFIKEERHQAIMALIEKNINSPLTSSLGRLFDGVASLCGIVHRTTYEAQAAIMLQKMAECFSGKITKRYSVEFKHGILSHGNMISELIGEINSGVPVEECAYKFHLWVVDAIVSVILSSGHGNVVFSGGCFQNLLLCSLLDDEMRKTDKSYFFNKEIPTNDAGVSFGQSIL